MPGLPSRFSHAASSSAHTALISAGAWSGVPESLHVKISTK